MSTESAALPKLYTPKEASEYLRTTEWSARELIRKGRIGSIRVGRRVLVPESALRDYVAGNAATAALEA